jgi:hypothetical protein
MKAIELINIIAKEHSRTSCSDENISNGFYHKSANANEWEKEYKVISNKYHTRCTRCALLELANGRSIDTDKVIDGISINMTIK